MVKQERLLEHPHVGRGPCPPAWRACASSCCQVITRETRVLAQCAFVLGDDGTNDLVVSEVLRTNELQVWFLSEHRVNVPLVKAQELATSGAAPKVALFLASDHSSFVTGIELFVDGGRA